MEVELPTVEQLYDGAVRLRDELDDEAFEDRDRLVSWPWLPLLSVFDYAHRLGLVRAAELPEQPISRAGARRKLDGLLPLLRARLPEVAALPSAEIEHDVQHIPAATLPPAPPCPVRVVQVPSGRALQVKTAESKWRTVAGITDGAVDAIALLVEAFPRGLTAAELKERSVVTDPGRAIRHAVALDLDLAAVVDTPGVPRRGGCRQAHFGRYAVRVTTAVAP